VIAPVRCADWGQQGQSMVPWQHQKPRSTLTLCTLWPILALGSSQHQHMVIPEIRVVQRWQAPRRQKASVSPARLWDPGLAGLNCTSGSNLTSGGAAAPAGSVARRRQPSSEATGASVIDGQLQGESSKQGRPCHLR